MMRNRAKLKVDLFDQLRVFFSGDFVSGRRNVDQSSDQSALRICDVHRLVRAHKQKTLKTIGVCPLEFFVHRHLLMRNKAVESRIILDFTQIAVVLDRHQRVILKRFQCELIAGAAQRFRMKHADISRKQLLNHIDNCGFTRTGSAIKYHEFLQFTAVA